jgi:hypothetical protein
MAASGAALESLESIEAALRAGVCLSWHRHSALQGVLYAWVEEYYRGELKPYTPLLPSPSAHLKDFVLIKPCFYRPYLRWQDLSKTFSLQTKRCNYKTNSNVSIKRLQHADV